METAAGSLHCGAHGERFLFTSTAGCGIVKQSMCPDPGPGRFAAVPFRPVLRQRILKQRKEVIPMITKAEKTAVIEANKTHEGDTGSP